MLYLLFPPALNSDRLYTSQLNATSSYPVSHGCRKPFSHITNRIGVKVDTAKDSLQGVGNCRSVDAIKLELKVTLRKQHWFMSSLSNNMLITHFSIVHFATSLVEQCNSIQRWILFQQSVRIQLNSTEKCVMSMVSLQGLLSLGCLFCCRYDYSMSALSYLVP